MAGREAGSRSGGRHATALDRRLREAAGRGPGLSAGDVAGLTPPVLGADRSPGGTGTCLTARIARKAPCAAPWPDVAGGRGSGRRMEDRPERMVQSDRQNHIGFEEKTVEVFGHWDCQPD